MHLVTTRIREAGLFAASVLTFLIGAGTIRDTAVSTSEEVSPRIPMNDSFETRVIKEALRYAAVDLLRPSSSNAAPADIPEPANSQRLDYSSSIPTADAQRQYLHATVQSSQLAVHSQSALP